MDNSDRTASENKAMSGERLRKALRRYMKRRRLKVNSWAVKAGISEGTLRNFLSGVSETLTLATLDALAEADGETTHALLTGVPHSFLEPNVIVVGEIEAGCWKDDSGISLDEYDDYLRIKVPEDPRFPKARRAGYLIKDNSADLLFPVGTIVIGALSWEIKNVLFHGSKVIIYKTDISSKKIEITARQIEVDDMGRKWLVTRTSRPDLSEVIAIPPDSEVFRSPHGDLNEALDSPFFNVSKFQYQIYMLILSSYRVE